MKNVYRNSSNSSSFSLSSFHSGTWFQRGLHLLSSRFSATSLSLLLFLTFGTLTTWGAEATISSASSNASAAYYLAPDGTAISAIAGADAKSVAYNSGSKITVDGKNNPNATITFTIASGVTITSFQVNGTKQNNTTYDLDGTSVTFGTALTSLSKTSSMTFRLHCTDASSSSSNRNTTITSIALTYTSAAPSDAYDIHIGKNNANYTDESLTNTSGSTWSKTITLDGGSYYEFKVKKTPSAGEAAWYGNDGKMVATTSPAWDFDTDASNCKLYTTVAGSYTFSWDASTNKLTVTYPAGSHPTKRIYMACGSTWCNDSPKFFVHSWGVTDYNTQVQQNACGDYYADIIWYNDYFQFTRNSSEATAYDDHNWNYSQNLTYNSSTPLWTCTGWSDGKGNFSASAYSPTTYTISYAAGSTTATGGAAISGSKADETKNCGEDFTLPSSAVFTAEGYVQVGWTTSDGGAQTHALGGTYTSNAAQTFYPVWEEAAPISDDCGEIIKSTFSGTKNSAVSTTTFNTTGEIGGTSTSYQIGDDGKLNTAGAYLILKLSTGTFLKGDTIKINSDKSGGVKFATGTVSTASYTLIGTANTATSGGQPYYFVLAANADSIIIPRGSSSSDYNQNPKIAYVSVSRPCDLTPCTPIVEPIATGGGTYDVGDNITLTASATSGITAGTTTYTWYRGNSGEAAAIAAGAIQATSTSNTYTISSAEVADAAVYYCVMSNGGDCSGVGSTSVSINVPAGSYTLTYDANAGGDAVSNLPAPEVHTPGTYTLSSLVPTRAGYTFLCWSRNAAGTNGCFEPGDSFTTGAENETLYAKWEEIPVRECENLFVTEASSTSAMTASVGSATYNISSSGGSFSKGGYSYYVKPNSSNCIVASPKAGSSFAAGDSLIFVVYNPNETPKTMGFKIGSNTYTTSVAAGTLHYFRHTLTAAEIVDGKVTFVRNGGDDRWVEVIIKTCDILPSCTTPTLPSLSDQEVCAGNDGTAWNATITNEGSLDTGESVSYEWKKKGSDVVLATTASYTPTDVTAADGGIYVVTATVSKTGYSDATASAEVTLTVKATATPMVTMTPSSVAPGETATLTATSSEGATFAWYRCDNAAGANPVNVGSGASYTTAALAVGSYYYKVVATGDGTHTCGTAEFIYQVEVAIPEQCKTYYWFPYATDATTNDVTNNEDSFFSGVTSGTNNTSTYEFSVDGENLTATKNTGSSSMSINFTIPAGKTGTLGINCKGSSSKPVYLTHSSGTPQILVSNNSSYAAFEITDISEGTWTLSADGSWVLCGMAVKVCTSCDPSDITVSNATPSYDLSVGGDFTEPTFTVKHSGVAFDPQPALSYTSSNTVIATVNETTGAVTFNGITGSVTITASFAGDGTYCASTASYTISINCGSEEAPKIVADAGTNLDGCNTTITLRAKKQDGTTDFASGSYQWYRDGEEIDGATYASYVVARAGIYTVTHTGACVQTSTNSATVTNTVTEPTVERLVPFQYYHEDKTYTAQMKDRHLFAVQSQGTLDGKPYSMTATRSGVDVLSLVEDALWVKSGGLSGVDTVMIDLNLLVDQGLSAGDEVEFVCSAIACGGVSPVNDNITLKVIDQTPTLAFICSGADGDGTRKKANFKYNGDFLTGYNKADLCLQTGGTAFDPDQELPLYTGLKEHYLITPVNGYAPFNILNYEPFDLLLLTDYPKATINDLTRNKLDSMYVLVDYRPMLSFKTHMVAKQPSSWAVKGFTTAPEVPKNTQTHMNIVCYAHPMFNALSHLETDEVNPDHDEEGQMVYKMLSGGGYDSSKGLQGFELSDAGNFVTIAFTHYHATASAPGADGTVTWTTESDDRKLISACERQTNIEARMILLSINADALCKLTEAGIAMVDSTLQYLLETDPLKVADCSLTFDDKTGDGKWSTPGNWAPRYNQIPNADIGAKIIKPCTVDRTDAIALSIKIEENGKLTIPATSALTVESSIRHMEGRILSAPSASEISIAANETGSGTLILNNTTEDTRASVQMYSKASTDGSTTLANWRWQYIGTPFNDVSCAMDQYLGSWIYKWDNGWNAVPKGGALEPFTGYCITHPDGARTYNMSGTLATTADQTINVPAGAYMVVGNSWTAPIQIDNFTDEDMKNLASSTVYFFNTGSDPSGTGAIQDEGVSDENRWAAGTYVPVPINSAPYTGDATIPAMQGFYVVGGASDGTLHLDYDRLVRPQKTGQNIVSGEMHAPRRMAFADGEPNVMKLFVGGNRYDDRLVLLEREDFTYGFDNGWDGDKWSGNTASPSVWTFREDNTYDAVSAIPDLEGTIIGFQAGEDDEYTFRFNYPGDADIIYLLDTDTKIYTRVLTGNTYTFTTSDKAEHMRFILTRSDAPEVTTSIESTSDNSLKGKAKKFINNGKMYIFVNGILYDATGKVVR